MKYPKELKVPVTRMSVLIQSALLMFWGLWYLAPCARISASADAGQFIENFNAAGYYGLLFFLAGVIMTILAYKGAVKLMMISCFTGFLGWIAALATIVAYDYTAPGVPIALFSALFFAYGYISLAVHTHE